MAYRWHMRAVVKYGRYNEYFNAMTRINEICAERGWAPMRLMAPFTGATNEVVMEADYPDLTAFERQSTAFFSDQEVMKVWRSAADVIVEGSGHDILYADAFSLA